MASSASSQWAASMFLKGLRVWGQSQGQIPTPFETQSPCVCLLSSPSWRFFRNTQLLFLASDIYIAGKSL